MLALVLLTAVYFAGLVATLTHAMHKDSRYWFSS